MELTRAWVAEVTGGRPVDGRAADDTVGTGIAFDSRALVPGEVFVALQGERDGHEFVADALAARRRVRDRGATHRRRTGGRGPRRARRAVRAARAPVATGSRRAVVGITGSVGKTSTKDLTAAAVGAALRTHAAPASYNNEIGVPVTVLGAPETTEVLVVEMGARFAGNIAALARSSIPRSGSSPTSASTTRSISVAPRAWHG